MHLGARPRPLPTAKRGLAGPRWRGSRRGGGRRGRQRAGGGGRGWKGLRRNARAGRAARVARAARAAHRDALPVAILDAGLVRDQAVRDAPQRLLVHLETELPQLNLRRRRRRRGERLRAERRLLGAASALWPAAGVREAHLGDGGEMASWSHLGAEARGGGQCAAPPVNTAPEGLAGEASRVRPPW